MKRILFVISAYLILTSSYAQTRVIAVMDSLTKEPVVGASVAVDDTVIGFTDNDGKFYSFIPKGTKVKVSFLGYQAHVFYAGKSRMEVFLKLNPYDLNEVMVYSAGDEEYLRQNNIGKITISGKKIELLPGVLGEADPFKYLQNYAGISWANEGSSSLIVRGSSGSENLVLIDGAPVFNISHLGGFFAVIPASSIKSLSFYKSYIPAKFSGRTASVTDIVLNEGSKTGFRVKSDLSTLSLNVNIQGPIVKNKMSFMLNMRQTYPDLFVKPFIKDENIRFSLNFNDLIGKVSWNVNSRMKIFFSYYYGRDLLRNFSQENNQVINDTIKNTLMRSDELKTYWYNHLISMRINKLWNNQLYSTVIAYSSTYEFNFSYYYQNVISERLVNQQNNLYDSISSYVSTGNFIQQNAIKNINRWIISNKFNMEFGFDMGLQRLTPSRYEFEYYRKTEINGEFMYKSDTMSNSGLERQVISSMFIDNNIDLGNLKFSLGLNVSAYNDFDYISIEPRISGSYMVGRYFALKAGIFRTSQNIHLIVPTYLDLPVDYWTFSNDKVKPLSVWSYSAGIYFAKKRLKLSGVLFYKTMNNTVKILPGQNLFEFSKPWYDKVDIGTGKSYGTEFSLQYTYSRVNIFANYTFLRSTRKFEYVNNGQEFNFKYDRTHYLNLTLFFALSKKVNISLGWHFTGGFWTTIPEQTIFYHSTMNALMRGYSPTYDLYGYREPVVSSINNYRLPQYHRLDLAVNYVFGKSNNIFTFGLYNAYNHKNIFSLIYEGGQFMAVSLFPVLPYFKLSFRID